MLRGTNQSDRNFNNTESKKVLVTCNEKRIKVQKRKWTRGRVIGKRKEGQNW